VAVYQSQFVTISKRIVDALLAALSARPAAALTVTPKLHLSADPAFAPTPLSVPGDFSAHEATFSGYTATGDVVVPTGPVNLTTTTQGLLVVQTYIRTLGSPDVGNTVYGWWLDDGSGFVAGEVFAGGGISLQTVGGYLVLEAALPLPMQSAAA
jgi:hypothetical protein